jgi:hypothetical protein
VRFVRRVRCRLRIAMPTMAILDDGRHSDCKSTTLNDSNPSLSHTTSQTRTIHQETALSSSPFHPTHHLVGFLYQDKVHRKLKTPCRRRRRHCHRSFAAFQDALPLILESTPADLGNTLPSLTRTARAVCDPPQQALSSIGPTHPPVQDLHRDTGLLENSNKPQHRSHQFDIGYTICFPRFLLLFNWRSVSFLPWLQFPHQCHSTTACSAIHP